MCVLVLLTYGVGRTSSLQNLRVWNIEAFEAMTRRTSCFTYPLFPDEELTFIHPDDAELFNAWDSRAFEVQVANHELLGHGSGKLFKEDASGTKNFNPDKVSSASETATESRRFSQAE